MALIFLSVLWLAGIVAGTWYSLPPWLIAAGLLPLPLLFYFRRYPRPIILASLGLFAFLIAAVYAYGSLHNFTEADLRYYRDRGEVTLQGIVSSAPEAADTVQRLDLKVTGIMRPDGWQPVAGKLRLSAPRYPVYEYGDLLTVTGKPEAPPRFDDFDYPGYLAGKDIYSVVRYPQITVSAREQGFPPLAWLYDRRGQAAATFAAVIPEPEAALAQGIILGIRGNIPESVREDFARSGIAHLLAISGLHLGIIAGMALSLGLWLFGRRRHYYFWLAIGITWLYALLTGMNPPVVRAAIMVSLFLSADALGRQRSALIALLFTAAVMAGISPYILRDVSFQLSFLAMAGLVLLFPPLQALARRAVSAVADSDGGLSATLKFLADSLSVTLAAVLAVAPVVGYYFGSISLVSPLTTLLALPALPAVIVSGAVTGLLGWISLAAAQVTGWLTWLFLLYINALAHTLALPGLTVASISPVLFILYYLALAAFARSRHRSALPYLTGTASRLKSGLASAGGFLGRLPLRFVIPPLFVAAALVAITAATMPDNRLHVAFLDVGEGDAILIRQGSQEVLIDGGPSPEKIGLELGKQLPFWDRTIELLVLTHPHQDHLAGLVEVLQRYRVERVIAPDLADDAPLYARWQELLGERGVTVLAARAGQRVTLGPDITLDILSPTPEMLRRSPGDVDNNSTVLRLKDGEIGFLFTADIREEAQEELIRNRAPLAATVLKVPHHGAATTSAAFLAAVNPTLAVISAGADNRFQHPSPEILQRLSGIVTDGHIFRTDTQGTIELVTDGSRLWMSRAP
ncbi:MAG: DNA internalization-related competence protein ComEC/Rec2 [Chloroflexota bacterium]